MRRSARRWLRSSRIRSSTRESAHTLSGSTKSSSCFYSHICCYVVEDPIEGFITRQWIVYVPLYQTCPDENEPLFQEFGFKMRALVPISQPSFFPFFFLPRPERFGVDLARAFTMAVLRTTSNHPQAHFNICLYLGSPIMDWEVEWTSWPTAMHGYPIVSRPHYSSPMPGVFQWGGWPFKLLCQEGRVRLLRDRLPPLAVHGILSSGRSASIE